MRKKYEEKEEKPNIVKEILEYVITLAIAAAVVLFINNVILINAVIPTESMVPTINKDDRIFGYRLSYKNNDPERFDIAVFKYPDDESQLFIKRIIGLPGETVKIKDGKVFINDSTEPLDDSFINEPQNEEYNNEELIFEVPENCYFMMGDNRNHSNDSRYWNNHFVAKDKIIGRAILRYWPFSKFGKI